MNILSKQHFEKVVQPSNFVFGINYELPNFFSTGIAKSGDWIVGFSHLMWGKCLRKGRMGPQRRGLLDMHFEESCLIVRLQGLSIRVISIGT